jgi:nucleoside-diphosphate-sugar epimerase
MNDPGRFSPDYGGIAVLVLGASGFIGRWVARKLCAQGAHAVLVVRSQRAAAPVFSRYGVQGKVVELDLRDSTSVGQLIRIARPVVTFNLAGYGVDPSEKCPETAQQINARLIQDVAESVAELDEPGCSRRVVIHAGSALEYGAIEGNLSENSVPNPTTLYGKTKLAGTLALARARRTYGLRGLTARLFTVYGPGEHAGRLLPLLLDGARSAAAVELTAGTQQRDFTYVEDVAEGLLRLGLTAEVSDEVLNLASGQLTRVRDFVAMAAHILGIGNDRLRFGALPTRPEEMAHAPVRVERLRAALGWIPEVTIQEGIRRTLAFNNEKGL